MRLTLTKTAAIGLALLCLGMIALPTAARAQAHTEDISAPTVATLTLNKTSIDTTAGPVDVTLTADFVDDLSGLDHAEVWFTQSFGLPAALFFELDGSSSTSTVTFPRNTRSGTWRVAYVIAVDNAGNKTSLWDPAPATTIEVVGQSVADGYNPTATAMAFPQPTIDITNADSTVTLSASFLPTSQTSGASVYLKSPTGQSPLIRFDFDADDFGRLPATATADLPQYAEPGTWTVHAVSFYEGYYDSVIYLSGVSGALSEELPDPAAFLVEHEPPTFAGLAIDDLQPEESSPPRYLPLSDLGIDLPALDVVGTHVDTTAPILAGISLDKSRIDITDAAVPVTATLDVSDDLSGVARAFVTMENGPHRQYFEFDGSSTSATVEFPRHAPTGLWLVSRFSVVDKLGNVHSWWRDSAAGDVKEMPELTVVGASDSTPPTILGVTASPRNINTSSSSAEVTVAMTITDDLSGLRAARVRFIAPDSAQTVTVDFDDTGGTQTATFPRYADVGTWTVDSVVAIDNRGNVENYGSSSGFLGDDYYSRYGARPLTDLGFSLPTIENHGVGNPIPGRCGGELITVNLAEGDEPSWRSEVILGTMGADVINGEGGDDIICGLDGNDTIIGGNGDDIIFGGGGVDRLSGRNGDDVIHGEGGSDRIWGGNGDDVVYAGSGADRVWGGNGNDSLFGMGGRDRLRGQDGYDTIQGNHNSDWIWGGDGHDTLRGGAGKDIIWGEAHSDYLYGGDNGDTLYGGNGTDHIDGQRGRDTCTGGGQPADTLISC